MVFTLLLSIALILLLQTAFFIVSLVLKNNSYADVSWGIGFILVALLSFIISDIDTTRRALVTALVIVWGVRLSLRIFLKNYGKPEDFRYARWRESWGGSFIVRSFFQIYLLQGALLLIVSLPVILVNVYGDGNLKFLDLMGLGIWTLGFLFESIGDFQLDRFVKNPQNVGKIMRYGLWQYSRHPNYFGESLQWFGIALIALSVSYGFIGLISPLLITFLLLKVSGIPMMERRFEGNPEFEDYKLRTRAFVPGLPKISL